MNPAQPMLVVERMSNRHSPVNLRSLVVLVMLLSSLLARIAFAANVEPGGLVELATCQDSWLDWKDDARRTDQYMESFDQGFTRIDEEAAFLPRHATTALGFPVAKIYPQSVGMGVGFSLLLAAPLKQVQDAVEKLVGEPLHCSVDEGMTTCGVELGEKKNLVLASESSAAEKSSLVGCFYYYEK